MHNCDRSRALPSFLALKKKLNIFLVSQFHTTTSQLMFFYKKEYANNHVYVHRLLFQIYRYIKRTSLGSLLFLVQWLKRRRARGRGMSGPGDRDPTTIGENGTSPNTKRPLRPGRMWKRPLTGSPVAILLRLMLGFNFRLVQKLFRICAEADLDKSFLLQNIPYVTSDNCSVADPGCLSWIPDPDFYPSRISDPGSRIQKQVEKRGVKKIFCQTFFCSHKFHKM
jgi:hypothetical protein